MSIVAKLRYGAGNWLGVVRANTVIVLDERTESRVLVELWDFLAGDPQVDEVLNRVTSGFGTELTGMPAFGILTFGEHPRVILRGDMTLAATTGISRVDVSGREVTTWSERSLPDAERLELRFSASGAELMLPLSEGVVRLSVLVVSELVADELLGGEAERAQSARLASEADLRHTLVSSDLIDANEPAEIVEPEPSVPADPLDATSSYDHLWDRTVARSVEDAAVRLSGEPGEAEALNHAPGADLLGAHATEPVVAEPAAAARVDVGPMIGAPTSGASVNLGGLIESVPWLRASATDVQATDVPAAAEPPVPDLDGRDLYAQIPGAQDSDDPDHDGRTVMRSELALAPSAPAQDAAPGTGSLVLARLCAVGHANPPTYSRCSECGQAVSGDARQVRRPILGRMRISSGGVVDLDRSLIVGRQPSVSRVHGDGMPQLVQVGSRAGDISRSHVEIRLEGWDVILVDLKATNGTVLVREGQSPRRLGQGEQAMLLDGDIAELGEDVSLRFEGLR